LEFVLERQPVDQPFHRTDACLVFLQDVRGREVFIELASFGLGGRDAHNVAADAMTLRKPVLAQLESEDLA
jgi:hypothetical protein